jgi:hypothetical protein
MDFHLFIGPAIGIIWLVVFIIIAVKNYRRKNKNENIMD